MTFRTVWLIKCLRLDGAKNIGKDRRVQKIDGSRQLVMRLRCIKKIGFQSELLYKQRSLLRLLKEKATTWSEKEQSKIDIIFFSPSSRVAKQTKGVAH